MEAEIKSFIFKKNQFYPIQIFGHKSRSIPGLQIHGPSKFANNLKNKIIYLCKINKISIPMAKYQICLDLNFIEKGNFQILDLESLEVPILILFLYLTDNLPITNLNRCFSFGEFSIQGKLTFNTYSDFLKNKHYLEEEDLIFLSPYLENCEIQKVIDLKELLSIVNPTKSIQNTQLLN